MGDPALFWERKIRQLEKSWRTFRKCAPEGVAELSTALGSIVLSARASGDGRLARRARRLRRRLSKLSTLQGNRELLSRVCRLGYFPAEAAERLDGRWEELAASLGQTALRGVRGRPMRKLRRALSRCVRRAADDLRRRLERSYGRICERLATLAENADDRELSRHRRVRGRIRGIAAAMEEAGAGRPEEAPGRGDRAGEALERWRALAVFRGGLEKELHEAERRGAMMLALDLDRLLAALDATLRNARKEAVAAAAAASNVVSFRRRSA